MPIPITANIKRSPAVKKQKFISSTRLISLLLLLYIEECQAIFSEFSNLFEEYETLKV